VSKIVSVKFHKTAEKVPGHAPAAPEAPVQEPKVEDDEDADKPNGATLEAILPT
jgi:hypothetical protein